VAVVRSFVASEHIVDGARGRVVEHELDMNRRATSPPPALARIRRLMHWLMPGVHAVAGAPMRSIDRELEDLWPSGNRQT
jgi:hypothetical protein